MQHQELASAWLDMASDSYSGASELFDKRLHLRSVVSRAYYAAYAKIHGSLVQSGVTLPTRGNFGHTRLPVVIQNGLRGDCGAKTAARLSSLIDTLYKLRLVADYNPVAAVEISDARQGLGHLATVYRELKERLL